MPLVTCSYRKSSFSMSCDSLYSESRILNYSLQFFAAEGPGGEKTEEATPKKIDDARKEGQVAKSQELITAFSLLTFFMGLKLFTSYIGNGFTDNFANVYESFDTYSRGVFNSNFASMYIDESIWQIVTICIPLFCIAVATALLTNALQVKWKPTLKPLSPKFNKINPINGFKRMFSADKLVELLKSLIKLGLIAYLVYSTLEEEAGVLDLLYRVELWQGVMLAGDKIVNLGLKISAFFVAIGIFDFIYQKLKFMKEMRMTKQEIKDEFKQSEGDPRIKGQIRQKMREASQRRMMQKLPEADVVITNPTHLACAIKYEKEISEAPVLIAKGADYLAQKIKDVARENSIPIVENKPLARMLYHNVKLDEEIPQELYQMTAEILAYVYSLKNS